MRHLNNKKGNELQLWTVKQQPLILSLQETITM